MGSLAGRWGQSDRPVGSVSRPVGSGRPAGRGISTDLLGDIKTRPPGGLDLISSSEEFVFKLKSVPIRDRVSLPCYDLRG